MSKDVKKRFEEKCIPEPNSGCWIWLYSLTSNGYGQFSYNGRQRRAIRVAYEIYKDKIPDGMIVRHKCDNKLCVNPDHLVLGTHNDNMSDMVKRNRQARGEKTGNNKLTEEQALDIYNSTSYYKELAQKYNITVTQVYRIKKGLFWAWLTKHNDQSA